MKNDNNIPSKYIYFFREDFAEMEYQLLLSIREKFPGINMNVRATYAEQLDNVRIRKLNILFSIIDIPVAAFENYIRSKQYEIRNQKYDYEIRQNFTGYITGYASYTFIFERTMEDYDGLVENN